MPHSAIVPITTTTGRDAANPDVIAESDAMRELLSLAARIAPSTLPVRLHGETGTGKDVVARVVHERSRRTGAFVAFNCAAVTATLADSALFGHVRGAFTGADAAHPGLFDQADGGTLLLDEVGDLDLAVQAKLLRVLEDGWIRPLGAARTHEVNVRVITATNLDLAARVEDGRFREDLFHRLSGALLYVPPLRERIEDIVPLTVRFLAQASADGRDRRISLEGWEWLKTRLWPGNVRELRQTIHRAAVLGGDRLVVEDFTRLAPTQATSVRSLDAWLVGKSWRQIETEVLRWALSRYGSMRAAAAALQRPHSTVADRVARLGVNRG